MTLKISVNTHIETPITGSTVPSFIKRAKELGRTHIVYTDFAYFTSLYRTYEMAKKEGIKTIAGVKIFFKDPNCDFLSRAGKNKVKYFTLNLYAKNQDQFQQLSLLCSKTRPMITTHGLSVPLWNWDDLKQAADIGLDFVHSDVQDVAKKYILLHRPDLVEPIVKKINGLFGSNHYLSVVGSDITHFHKTIVEVKLWGGESVQLFSDEIVKTDRARSMFSIDLVTRNGHNQLISYVRNGVNVTVGKQIEGVVKHEGFLKIPDDPQLAANRVAVALSKQLSIPLLYSDDAFYAADTDKIVQDVRLAQDGLKEHARRHMQTSDEAAAKIKACGGEPDLIFAELDRWGERFDFNPSFETKLPSCADTMDQIRIRIKALGRLPDDQNYRDRLKYEIDVLKNNGKVDLLSYFMPILEVFDRYREQGVLVGPGRGSVGGCLLAYLIGITDVDPIKHELSFERFLSLDRILAGNFPDVDCIAGDVSILTINGYIKVKDLAKKHNKNNKLLSFCNGEWQYQHPKAIFSKGDAQVNRYFLDNGRYIDATPEHLVLTDIGWNPIELAFQYGLDIIEFSESK